ncbi:allophanate hydrolase subunit 1 [Rhodophyticola sp. CCM32]|uniref:5-oxoprolinase subunit B family protein n=1 Tax=Rhodophyticola sp. CCM32 TaxID=2916397 RepID=UPI00107F482C|nr:allophanate hydrolase subunit 1 [Rhodophyticola sp. CCM32]QBY00855.1 allophanate hydrolase subunit 1 [Rhodophyticola sp. CCM32]
MPPVPPETWPVIRTVGLTGLLVSFADVFSEAANRAALAFRAAVDRQDWPGVEETAPSLVSVFLRIDPLTADHTRLKAQLSEVMASRDWYAAPLPEGRRLFRVPTVYGTDLAPDLPAAAEAAGVSEAEAITQLSSARLRVLTVGFAPGQPYLGELPENWNLPRRAELNPMVPAGAMIQAIRQCVLFSRPSPTGWRHVGQTAFHNFRPDSADPFPLTPGDEVQFVETDRAHVERLLEDPGALDGGAGVEVIG